MNSKRENVISVAWTGIAATLLSNGKTAHSTFHIPLELNEHSESSLGLNTNKAAKLRNAKLIIWDEASMVPKYALRVVDNLLRDIMQVDIPFGGKIVILGGDFRQIPPVKTHATKIEIIENSITQSELWKYFHIMKLNENMRADKDEKRFIKFLLDLGEGLLKASSDILKSFGNDMIKIPKECITNGISIYLNL